MLRYEQDQVLKAFSLFSELAQKGVATGDLARAYKVEEPIRSLTDHFVEMNDAVCLSVGQELYLVPKTKLSPFHISNEQLKKMYLGSKATNADLYLLYFCSIVLIGCFYDSYQSVEPTLNFITLDEWLNEVNKRMDSLKEHDEEKLEQLEMEFSYRWTAIIEKWDALDDVKETANKQSGNTLSRLSFLDTVRRFLIGNQVVEDIGNGEMAITEKTKVIVGRYFMEREFNRGILEFLYAFEEAQKNE
ncbi:DUF6063 family protein [Ureibacillus sp. MALMAid1270]|uniref:DUF6063 family protein n=1 Tax=Ureibacillus sp. MALMAid1270 TaxID=3411629 RepID=UPI003BA763EF